MEHDISEHDAAHTILIVILFPFCGKLVTSPLLKISRKVFESKELLVKLPTRKLVTFWQSGLK